MSKKNKLIPELRFPEFEKDSVWVEKTLGEVLIKNSTKNKNLIYSLVESVSNKFGFIKQDEYFENRRVASKDTSNYYIIKKGYFAYNPSRIDVGSLAYKQDGETSIISPLYVSFKANSDLINDYFLLSFFNSFGFTKQMIFEGGVRNTLNYENLIQIKIPIPTPQEQQKIASCLSSLDELIEAHSQKLELLKDHKKGLMQNLFPQEGEKIPKFRFKEFENDGEWEEKKFGEILIEGKLGGNYENIESNEGVPIIKMGNIDRGKINLDKIQYLPQNTSYNDDDILKEGDLLFNTRNTLELVGKVAIWRNELSFALYNSNLMRMIFDKKHIVSNFFMNYVLNTDLGLKKLKSIATGTTSVAAIYTKDLLTINISFPSKPEQQKIASTLSTLDELIQAQTEKIEQLKQHKKGLMQGLFPKR